MNFISFSLSPKSYIYFSKPDNEASLPTTKFQTSLGKKNEKFLSLANFEVIKFIPRLFTITTQNGTYKFNIDVLKEASSVIKNTLQSNPTYFQYELQTNDKENIMKKYEQLFLGEKIRIFKEEEESFNNIANELKMTKSINLKKTTSSSFYFTTSTNKNCNSLNLSNCYELQINKKRFYSFLIEKVPQTFIIYTKSNQYKCNIAGVNSSLVIHELLCKKPDLMTYEYDFDDEFDEFQLICDLFNFEKVPLTQDNMHSLKVIAEDLQIDFILTSINNFIDDYNNRVQTVDDQQSIIDSMSELFETLFKIKEVTVNFAKDLIVESSWSKTTENVQELAAFILQAIQTDSQLHPYLADLIELLDKEANEKNKLGILVPFIIKKLMKHFAVNNMTCLFIYTLYKRGLIEKVNILSKLEVLVKQVITFNNKIDNNKNNVPFYNNNKGRLIFEEAVYVFIPELYELMNCDMNYFLRCFKPQLATSFISPKSSDNFEQIRKMRDAGEPEDQITRALRNDDVDTLQSIIATNQIDPTKKLVPYNIFEKHVPNGQTNYINYAAAYGSLKCFKYLLLNHSVIDDNSMKMALFGGNSEIIQIVDQRTVENETVASSPNKDIIIPTIIKHSNDLFNWVFENKFRNSIDNIELINLILKAATINGDISSIAAIIDKGFNFFNIDEDICNMVIRNTSENGFYKLLQFLMIVMKKKIDESKRLPYLFDIESSVKFGNLSIFLLFYDKVECLNAELALTVAIQNDSINIIEYIFDNIFEKKIIPKKQLVYKLLSNSIQNKSTSLFVYLINKLKEMKNNPFFDFIDSFLMLLNEACYSNTVELAKIITDLILVQRSDKNIDFTLSFFNAIIAESVELCHFFIDKKVFIDFDNLVLQYPKLAVINKSILDIVVKRITPNAKDTLVKCYLIEAIRVKNKHLIEYLLNENAPYSKALFEAVKTDEIEIVEIILNHDSKPSFINQVFKDGTALFLAVSLNNLTIVKRLLLIPGIDPSLYENNNTTPLLQAIKNLDVDCVLAILDFYGDEIKTQQWQINEAIKILINNFSTFGNKNCLRLEIFKHLNELNQIDINMYSPENGNTILMSAISICNIQLVEFLINSEEININQRNYLQETALLVAVRKSYSEIVELIINSERFDPVESRLDFAFYLATGPILYQLYNLNCLDVNYKACTFSDSIANKQKQRNTIDYSNFNYVINSLNMNSSDLFETPLTLAVKNSNISLIDLIIKHHSFDPDKSCAKKAVISSFISKKFDIFRKLVNFLNCDINLINEDGLSLFEVAVGSENKQMMNELLNNETFDSKRSNFLRAFVLSFSFKKPNLDIMNELVEFDKKHDKLIDFKQVLPDGKTFFTKICQNSDSIEKVVKFFIENGVDPNAPDKYNKYPLQHAIKSNFPSYVDALVDSGKVDYSIEYEEQVSFKPLPHTARQNKTNKTTCVHLACEEADVSIVSTFIEKVKLNVNVTDSNGDTPLIQACRFENIDCINRLFEVEDLDYLHCNDEGKDALQILSDSKIETPKTKDEYKQCLLDLIACKDVDQSGNESNKSKNKTKQNKEPQKDEVKEGDVKDEDKNKGEKIEPETKSKVVIKKFNFKKKSDTQKNDSKSEATVSVPQNDQSIKKISFKKLNFKNKPDKNAEASESIATSQNDHENLSSSSDSKPLNLKIEKKSSFSSSKQIDDDSDNEDLIIKEEIASSIFGSVEDISIEQVQKISEILSSVVKKQANKLASQMLNSNKQNDNENKE